VFVGESNTHCLVLSGEEGFLVAVHVGKKSFHLGADEDSRLLLHLCLLQQVWKFYCIPVAHTTTVSSNNFKRVKSTTLDQQYHVGVCGTKQA
jgi:hypothetical protein